jgi:hypothetical protein
VVKQVVKVVTLVVTVVDLMAAVVRQLIGVAAVEVVAGVLLAVLVGIMHTVAELGGLLLRLMVVVIRLLVVVKIGYGVQSHDIKRNRSN